MSADPDYLEHGATLVRGLLPREVAAAMAHQISLGVRHSGQTLLVPPSLGTKACYEAYCYQWPVLLTLLWGLTPRIEQLTGVALLPTYSYFRTYQQGDVCRVHFDRPACEHSLSLTLAYADGIPWALGVARQAVDLARYPGEPGGSPDFSDEVHDDLLMEPGDAVLYRGLERRHGRTTPNPNRWSAHVFLHWVDRNGPHAAEAFDRQPVHGATDFVFPAS